MPNIKVTSADPKSTDTKLLLVLSDTPPEDWTADFNRYWTQAPGIKNLRLSQAINKSLLIITGQVKNAQQVLDEVKKVIEQTNGESNDFEQQLKNLKF